MYRTQCLFALLALYVGLVHCFSWDFMLGGRSGLFFYNNGTLMRFGELPTGRVSSITYDPVHNRVLFIENSNGSMICSYDMTTKKMQKLVRCKSYSNKLVYDPATDTVFQTETYSIYSYSLKPGSDNVVDRNPTEMKLDTWPVNIAVDSCEGYIYWITYSNIERARLDGSEREVVIDSKSYFESDLVIDQQTRKMYWVSRGPHESFFIKFLIQSADLDGKNKRLLYSGDESMDATLAVTKDFIYWRGLAEDSFWRLPKNPPHDTDVQPERFSPYCYGCRSMATNYQIEDQTRGTRNCTALTSLLPSISSNVFTDGSLRCVYGIKVIGESVCNCTHGYTGDRCDVSLCQNYCLHGDCSVTIGQQPICSCNTGYSGERCEVHACHKHCLNNGICSLNEDSEPVCQCMEGYKGERCDISVCQDYCFGGYCSVSGEGQPVCRCNAGYSAVRCEVSACHEYCSNNSVYSLNEESAPVCQCAGDIQGERCNVSVCQNYCIQGECIVGDGGHPECRCNVGYSGERCDINVCQGYCLNNGVCTTNEDSEPICQCAGDYEGDRCDVSVSVVLMKCVRIISTLATLRDIVTADVTPVTLDRGVLQMLSEKNTECGH